MKKHARALKILMVLAAAVLFLCCAGDCGHLFPVPVFVTAY